MTESVAILGCGPAGLMVAHAAMLNGMDFRIMSLKRKSKLFGAQYLHAPIPGVSESTSFRDIRYNLVGTNAGYADKIYGGSVGSGEVSPETMCSDHRGWDIRQAYDSLWESYSDEIEDLSFNQFRNSSFPGFDVVISTIPRKLWAIPEDTFVSTKVWAFGDAPELEQRCPFRPPADTVICDGTKDVSWYRASHVFGHATIEWPGYRRPPLPGVVMVEKPISHNSRTASDIYHLGRYGAWKKGVLSSDAFSEAMKILGDDPSEG